MYYLNIYIQEPKKWLLKYDLKEKTYKDTTYFQLKGDYNELNSVKKRLISNKIRFKMFEERYQKSYDYRKDFLENNPGPYRCRYCNRWLKTEYMQVDHIIPASKAQKDSNLQIWLWLNKCESVNDLKNLVPSCNKCNQQKGRKIGLWPLRAYLGQFKAYWKIKKTISVVIIGAAIGLIAYYLVNNYQNIVNSVHLIFR